MPLFLYPKSEMVDTEAKSVIGRADVVIKTKNDIYVLELKVDDTVDNALASVSNVTFHPPLSHLTV